MTVIVANENALPARFIEPNSVNASAGLLSFLLIGILPVVLAGLLSAPACPPTPPCPVTTPTSQGTASPVSAACPVATPCPAIMPIPVTTPCPAPPQCEPIPACPDSFIQLSNNDVPIENRCFHFGETSRKSFRDAIVECAKLGGGLLNIQTVEEGQAVYDYIDTFFPTDNFWAGYTDFVADDTVVGLSGGSTPIPSFGTLTTATADQDCLTLYLDEGGNNRYEDCSNSNYYICDMNLATQKCVCPP